VFFLVILALKPSRLLELSNQTRIDLPSTRMPKMLEGYNGAALGIHMAHWAFC
jgi:hypothetical protein